MWAACCELTRLADYIRVVCADERWTEPPHKLVTCFLPRYLRPVRGTRTCSATGADCRKSPVGTAGSTAGNSACENLLLGHPPCAKGPGSAHEESSKDKEVVLRGPLRPRAGLPVRSTPTCAYTYVRWCTEHRTMSMPARFNVCNEHA